MSKAKLSLMLRVFKTRMAAGETFDEVAADYPKLSQADLDQLKEALEG